MAEVLTDRQAKLLRFIQDHIRAKGFPPTIREIGQAFRYRSTGTVRDHVRALVAKGQLRVTPGKSRGIMPHQLATALPILGRVRAGGPVLADENMEGAFDLTREFSGDNVFALKVRGDSMEEAGIQAGDLVIVRAQGQVETGAIVVATVEGEATVKRLGRRGSQLELQPANKRYQPLPVGATTRVVGRVIGVIRSYERRF